MDLQTVEHGLARFVTDTFGTSARADAVQVSDGHAGLTFLFDVVEANATRTPYVIKLPPKGVRRRGNTDVYRQAPLLRALHDAGMPVPAVPWAYEDNPWFELPFIVMERLPGRVFFLWDPPAVFDRRPDSSRALWRACAETLPRLHALDWQTALPDWERPEPPADQVTRWEPIYAQAPEPAWATAAERCERALLDSLPDGAPVGLFHGDYQPGNVLYHAGRLTGVIDWELAGIGAQLLDLGWLMMTADPASWPVDFRPMHPIPPEEIRAIYEAGSGRACGEAPWYQALAGYRLGSIACLNVKLHRTGQRHDPVWEGMGRAVPHLFGRAQALLDAR